MLRCCVETWINPASEKVCGKQCCAVACTLSAFLLRLKFGHIFFLSCVALLHGEYDLDYFRKSFWKAVLRSCNHLLSFSAKAQIRTYIFLSSVALLRGAWNSDCFKKSFWEAVLRSCNHLLSFSAKAQILTYIFFKQCCAVAWRLEFRLLQKKVFGSSVAQLQPTSQLFC